MSAEKQVNLGELGKRIRQHCVRMTGKANVSHVGGSLSAADLLAAIYGRALRYDPRRPESIDRDRFIMSKGHACSALYAVLAESGYFPVEQLDSFYQNGSPLAGHVMHKNVSGVELSTGSLSHGRPVTVVMDIAEARVGRSSRIFYMISGGEWNSGSDWVAALVAPHR